jgi:hypothetical protein
VSGTSPPNPQLIQAEPERGWVMVHAEGARHLELLAAVPARCQVHSQCPAQRAPSRSQMLSPPTAELVMVDRPKTIVQRLDLVTRGARTLLRSG